MLNYNCESNRVKNELLIDKEVEYKVNGKNTIINKPKEYLNIINSMERKQTKGLNRNTIDKYYTKEVIVDKCLNFIKKNIEINKEDLIVEPSAGNGSFIEGIKSISKNYIFYDIEPENDEIIKQDYLLF